MKCTLQLWQCFSACRRAGNVGNAWEMTLVSNDCTTIARKPTRPTRRRLKLQLKIACRPSRRECWNGPRRERSDDPPYLSFTSERRGALSPGRPDAPPPPPRGPVTSALLYLLRRSYLNGNGKLQGDGDELQVEQQQLGLRRRGVAAPVTRRAAPCHGLLTSARATARPGSAAPRRTASTRRGATTVPP